MLFVKREKVEELAKQILFYADNSVTVDMAMREAEDYFRRKRMSSVFVHKSTLSGMGKKLAYKCMGERYV